MAHYTRSKRANVRKPNLHDYCIKKLKKHNTKGLRLAFMIWNRGFYYQPNGLYIIIYKQMKNIFLSLIFLIICIYNRSI